MSRVSRETLFFAPVETKLGELLIAGDGKALVFLSLKGALGIESLRAHAEKYYATSELISDGEPLEQAAGELIEFALGARNEFEIAVAPAGSVFDRRVWNELCGIPYGETRTYGALAKALGEPGASQAVGGANGRNPIPIVIPCHRCVAAAGLGGFSGGLERKLQLLELERTHAGHGQTLMDFGG